MSVSYLSRKTLFTMAVSLAAITASTSCSYAAPQEIEPGTHQVDVTFTNVQSETGMIWARLCTEEQYENPVDNPCAMNARVEAKNGAALSFNDVPSGTYAVSVYHDSNDNQTLDFDTRGIPFEPTGNSGNARGFFGPPKFKQMKFTLSGPGDDVSKKISIKLSTVRVP